MTNQQQIRQRLSEIEEAVNFFKQSQSETFDERDRLLLGRYYLQIALEAMLNIGNQLIANMRLRKPSTYREIIEVLREAKIVPVSLSEKLLPFVDLRNRLVHTYWKISKDELLRISKEQLPVFETFVKLVLHQLKNNQ